MLHLRLAALALLAPTAFASSAYLLKEDGSTLSLGECLVSGEARACLRGKGSLTVQGPDGEVTFTSPEQKGRDSSFSCRVDKSGSLAIYREKGFWGRMFGKGEPLKRVFSIGAPGADYAWLSPKGHLELYSSGVLYDAKIWSSLYESPGEADAADKVDGAGLVDPATGVKMPSSFDSHGKSLKFVGVGVRAKTIAMVHVNVYSVGFYVSEADSKKKLASFRGKSLVDNRSFYDGLLTPGPWSRSLKLVFVRSVGAEKVVDALTALNGVDKSALSSLSSILLEAIGANIHSGDSIDLTWDGGSRLSVAVRGAYAGDVVNTELPPALYKLYFGDAPVAPAAKAAVAAGMEALLG